jgi:hypothetical protein
MGRLGTKAGVIEKAQLRGAWHMAGATGWLNGDGKDEDDEAGEINEGQHQAKS